METNKEFALGSNDISPDVLTKNINITIKISEDTDARMGKLLINNMQYSSDAIINKILSEGLKVYGY